MMREYDITVSVPHEDDGTLKQEHSIIAEASKYLAYADQTDTFGYSAAVTHANVLTYKTDDDTDHVYMRFLVPLPGIDSIEEFNEELERLAHVEAYAILDRTNLMR